MTFRSFACGPNRHTVPVRTTLQFSRPSALTMLPQTVMRPARLTETQPMGNKENEDPNASNKELGCCQALLPSLESVARGYQRRAPYLAINPLFRGARCPLVPLALIASSR